MDVWHGRAPSDGELCDLARDLLVRKLPELIADPGCAYEILSIKISKRFSALHSSTYRTVVAEIYTNNRPKFIGALPPFDPLSLSGFNSLYLSAFFDGQLATLFSSDVADEVTFELDVSPSLPESFETSPVSITLNTAIEKGFVDKYTPTYDLAIAENLDWVSLYGGNVIGPSFEGIKATLYAIEQELPRSAVDLFAGTGSISRILLSRGVKSVILVDNAIEFGQCVDGMAGDWLKVTENAFKYEPSAVVDLTIVDLFCDDVLMGVTQLSKRISGYSNRAIFHLGWSEKKVVIRECVEFVEKFWATIEVLKINNSIYCYAKQSKTL